MSDDTDDGFDYGEKREDGQYENHPTIEDGEFQQPVRRAYVHDEGCGDLTRMGTKLAESVARNPEYYDETFCASCGDYFDTSEFRWRRDGAPWVIPDEKIEDWMEGSDDA